MNVSYKSLISQVTKDIKNSDKKLRTEAARYLVKKIKDKINEKSFDGIHSQPGQTPKKMSGTLRKGIGYEHNNQEQKTLVGARQPAFYAHMLEFGTEQRSQTTKNGKTRSTGKIIARPFILPTFDEEKGAVEDIMSKGWL